MNAGAASVGPRTPRRVAIVGAGLAGAACAAALQAGGCAVRVYEKSRGVGGRMSTRRARWCGADGVEHAVQWDHGAQYYTVRSPGFEAFIARAAAQGLAARWTARVQGDRAAIERWVGVPDMPALARLLTRDIDVVLETTVLGLVALDDGGHALELSSGARSEPYDAVVLAIPPAQAAALLDGHDAAWAGALRGQRMDPCLTLMGVTDELDWPWEAARPTQGPLAWLARDDRKPGRPRLPGIATWVAQATPEWSAQHLEGDPAESTDELRAAVADVLGQDPRWCHSVVHRWLYAKAGAAPSEPLHPMWNARRGLGVCGDFQAGPRVEAAWCAGTALAAAILGGDTDIGG